MRLRILAEGFPAPVPEFGDPLGDELRCRLALARVRLFHVLVLMYEGFRMRSDIIPGAPFPDYELTDHTAKRRKLSELQGQHPMVLVLSQGALCPQDRRQAEGLVALHRELAVLHHEIDVMLGTWHRHCLTRFVFSYKYYPTSTALP